MTPNTRSSHRLRALVVTGGTAAALLVAAAPSSAADTTAKASGTTTIKLSSALTSAMKKGKVALRGVAPARRGATAVKLPLSTATFNADGTSGTLNHAGSLKFVRRGRSITLKTFRIAVAPSGSNVTVGIGSSRVRAFNVDTSAAKVVQTKKKLTLSNLKVTLTPIGASRLNRALKIQRFKSGMSLGVTSASVDIPAGTGTGTPSTGSGTVFKSGTASLTLTDAAKAGIAATPGASLNTTAPATGAGTGPYAFPITGGTVDGAKAFAGSVTLAGALNLTADGQTLTLSDLIIDTANSVITAVVGGTRIEAFSLDQSPLRSVAYDGQLVLGGIVVKRAKTGPLSDQTGAAPGVIGTLRIEALTK
ncbi:hypothetical protein AB0L40_19140 [Patulibacter sp. NPDC049589]|uniref:hypothetical protein n=1 Tax=Patulibacter sp. NPDC049589 TaxID=3154731 RepID=UPI0034331AB7